MSRIISDTPLGVQKRMTNAQGNTAEAVEVQQELERLQVRVVGFRNCGAVEREGWGRLGDEEEEEEGLFKANAVRRRRRRKRVIQSHRSRGDG